MPLLHRTFDAILRCLKRKAFTSSDDLVGVIVYNTVWCSFLLAYFLTQNRKKRNQIRRAQMLKSTFIAYSQLSSWMATIYAISRSWWMVRRFYVIYILLKLSTGSRADPELLSRKFKPAVFENNRTSMPIGNLYISCNRFFRNKYVFLWRHLRSLISISPQTKNASKRIFHITCNDEPQKNAPEDWLTASRTNASVSTFLNFTEVTH